MFETSLGEAISEWLISKNIIPTKLNPLTDELELSIYQDFPPVPADMPCILFSIPVTEPLLEDNPATNHFKSKVIISIIDHSELKSKQLADNLCIILTNRPFSENSSWFPDMSNECVKTNFVKFKRKFSPRGDLYDTKTDINTQTIELDIVWSYCCLGTLCDEFNYCTTTTPNPEDEIVSCN